MTPIKGTRPTEAVIARFARMPDARMKVLLQDW